MECQVVHYCIQDGCNCLDSRGVIVFQGLLEDFNPEEYVPPLGYEQVIEEIY